MPKTTTTPFTYYTFRYDYTDDNDVERIKKYVIRDIPKYALFLEISADVKKKHIQGKLGKCISEEQLRKHFKKEFPNLFVKSNYSIKSIKDIEKYDSYICKDGNVLCNNVFTDEYIQEQVEIHKDNVIAFESKKQKNTTETFTQKVFKDFCKEFPFDVKDIQTRFQMNSDYHKEVYDKACKNLLRYLLKRLGDVVKVFDDTVLQRMYNGLKNSIINLDVECSQKNLEFYLDKIQL